jgi:hypothetical protein
MSISGKNVWSLILVISICFSVNAQGDKYRKTATQHLTGEPFIIYYMMYDQLPFYEGDWVNGSVTLLSGDEYKDMNLKFDMYKNQLLYFNSTNKSIVVIDNEIIRSFTLTSKLGKTEVFKRYKTRVIGEMVEKYYSVLVEDSISLVLKHESLIENYPYANPASKKIGKFIYKQKYCFIVNQELHTLPKSKYRLYQSFPSIKDDLKHFIHQKHLKLKRQDDLIQIFKEINLLKRNKCQK